MAKKSIQPKIKEPVRLRSKKLADGSESLYLDIYRDGRRSYEFLKLYIHPETGPQIKTLNSETMKTANTIKMERILEITHNEAGLKHTSSRAKMLLKDWMQAPHPQKRVRLCRISEQRAQRGCKGRGHRGKSLHATYAQGEDTGSRKQA